MAAFYKWEASLFLVLISMIIEMLVLATGILIVGEKLQLKKNDISASALVSSVIFMIIINYPIAINLGLYYNEFGDYSGKLNWIKPIWDNKGSILLIAVSIGTCYLSDFAQLKSSQRGERFTTELFRLSMQLFFLGISGIMCILYNKELNGKDDILSKWIPILQGL